MKLLLLAIGISLAVASCAQYERATITEYSAVEEKISEPVTAAAPAMTNPSRTTVLILPPPPPAPMTSSPTVTEPKINNRERLVLASKKNQPKIPTVITPSIDYDDEFKKQLLNANTALSIPEQANITDDVRVELLISLVKEANKLALDLSESGKQFAAPVFVTRTVAVTLTAPDFEVKAVTPERQILNRTDNTTWLWTLKPKSVGKHKIDVGIVAIIKLDHEETEYQIKTFKKTVEIEITATQIIVAWFSKYWQWIVSTIVLPLLLWAYKNRKRSTEQS
jgi:hypothetical protein